MPDASSVDLEALRADAARIEQRYREFVDRGLSLDMTRGKPCPEQLDLADGLLTAVKPGEVYAEDGTDCRNYGGVEGLPEARALFADFLEVAPAEVLVGDNGSLGLMHDCVAWALSHGVPGGDGPWSRGPVRFLCPSPGYDRHFTICEHFGIEMVPVQMGAEGPDMDEVERRVAEDEAVKGLWLVPRYSNPTGVTLGPHVVERLARMPARAADFRILWDNAYAHHHLVESPEPLANLLELCKQAGHPDRAWIFGSTSKISFAGAGVAAMAGSEANVAWLRGHRAVQTIGPDKLNQLRHVRFFRDLDGIRAHMRRHAGILRPKFQAVQRVLERELGGSGLAEWTDPDGGYFVSLDTLDGCARSVVELAGKAGVRLTPAGATFPYGRDPRDRNIRIAPSLPSEEEIETAMEVLAVCVRRASLDRLG